MQKKLFTSVVVILCILLYCTASSFAAEYLFTVNENFPLPYSADIEAAIPDLGIYSTDSFDSLQPYIEAGLIKNFEENGTYELFEYTTNDTYYPEQTNLAQIYTQFAWNRNAFGANVKVAVIDTGIYTASGDFESSRIIKCADYTDTAETTDFCNDLHRHGTMAAGIIGAKHNSYGIAGIAPKTTLYIFKAFDASNKSTYKKCAQAIKAAADEGVDIINMSWGGEYSSTVEEAINYAAKKGILLIAAAGNDGNSTVYYPASFPSVISVGSVRPNGSRSDFSQRNNYVNIMAPGGNDEPREYIYSSTIPNKSNQNAGTSFSAPHVTGAAALAKSLNPSLTAEEITNALYLTADAISDKFSGHGTLNIQSLLTYVKATVSDDLIYSENGKAVYMAYIPPKGCRSYFVTYTDNMLQSIFTADENTFIKGDSTYLNAFRLFTWGKESLAPYKAEILKTQY